MGLACSDAFSPEAQVCAEVLALQFPGAEPLEAWSGAHGVALDYRIPGEDAAGVHRIECLLAEPERRVQSLRIDGRELSEAELVLVSSELLLAKMRRAGHEPPGVPPFEATWASVRAGAIRIGATLSSLTREALSMLEGGWRRSREDAEEREAAKAQV